MIYLRINNCKLKKISLILLLAVLVYSQVGYYFVLRYSQEKQKEAVKKEILGTLKLQDLEAVSVNDHPAILWEEEGKEFLLNGEMYDVVKSSTVNGKQILYCINDKKEKTLIDRYNTITNNNSSADKKGKNNIGNASNLFFSEIKKNTQQEFVLLSRPFTSFDTRLTSVEMDTFSPPPRA